MHTPMEQETTNIDQRIRDFMDRKTSPWREFSQMIVEKLLPTAYHRSTEGGGVRYEILRWRH